MDVSLSPVKVIRRATRLSTTTSIRPPLTSAVTVSKPATSTGTLPIITAPPTCQRPNVATMCPITATQTHTLILVIRRHLPILMTTIANVAWTFVLWMHLAKESKTIKKDTTCAVPMLTVGVPRRTRFLGALRAILKTRSTSTKPILARGTALLPVANQLCASAWFQQPYTRPNVTPHTILKKTV